jgi:predicted helicase
MSVYAIRNYHRELEKIIHFGGTKKETAIRNAFYTLLNQYANTVNLLLIPELTIKNRNGRNVTPDGTIKDALRLDHGYWESKDEADDINEEIRKKFDKGYPSDNILFEDSQTAVLFQDGEEVMRVPMQDEEALDKVLDRFIAYQRKEISEFQKAIDQFKQDIPTVTTTLRSLIHEQDASGNQAYHDAFALFHESCKNSINPEISADDIREMMVQHILSADIFNTIFDEPHFHSDNNIARQLNQVIEIFFTGAVRRNTLSGIQHYYQTINAAAAGIADHHEKQKFLKVIYENFYKAYNPKAADRLGIVYTPNEIVQFMIKGTDWLLHKHFGKSLADKNVDILDPATGTGTFICDIIDYLPKNKLEHKYKHELHANELAILPYYIANLNIEFTYKQKMGNYAEFENLCLVDTLDNTGFHWVGKQGDLFGVSAENAARIKKQNERKISVIIGNPPYNANQQNENENNKNREYPMIDKRIKETFIKNSTAQKTKMYDMYSRFYRWAMDRLNENGIIAFITNRSFIESRTFDGFRKIVQSEFDYAYILDTKSDVRANPKIAGTTHNVFGIQTGVAILFLVKTSSNQLKPHDCRIEYFALEDEMRKEEKLQWIAEHGLEKIEFANIAPDPKNNWLNISENNWNSLIALCSKEVKNGDGQNAIFKSFSLGIATNRDEWVYDFSFQKVSEKAEHFINIYNSELRRWGGREIETKISDFVSREIKWTSELESHLKNNHQLKFAKERIRVSAYRCFVKKYLYFDSTIIHRPYQNINYYGLESFFSNCTIALNTNSKTIDALATNLIANNHFIGDSQCLPLFTYAKTGEKSSNITPWAIEQFTTKYNDKSINDEAIFHYIYAVLHHPAYRKKYEINLKREFPRIPLYDDFWQWAKWGEALMNLHLNYETETPWGLVRKDIEQKQQPKAKLKADKSTGVITLDENTELQGIPALAWTYKLGNRSALEWILDQYKEKKPSDPTIAEKFNTYKFADYKEKVIDLLDRVCRVSVDTMEIIGKMPESSPE